MADPRRASSASPAACGARTKLASASSGWRRSSLRRKISEHKSRSEPVFPGRAEGVGFEPTRTRQRPNGFQDHPWFVVRRGHYLGFQHVDPLRRPRSSRVYPVTTSIGLAGRMSALVDLPTPPQPDRCQTPGGVRVLSRSSSRVRSPGTFTASRCPAVTEGLDRFREPRILLRRVGGRPPTLPPAYRLSAPPAMSI